MIRRLAGLLAALVIALSTVPCPAEASAPLWTVFVYMIGTDLEADSGLATADLEEMQQAVRPDTRLLVMTGGSVKWQEDIPGDACTIWEVTQAGMTPAASVTGRMGDAQTLAAFLRTDRGGAPNTLLILWDHGYGPMEGFGKDDLYLQDRLTLEELASALKEAEPFTAVGFDACLMGGCETAIALAPYASYLLSSQETEPPNGWDYSFLSSLEGDPVEALSGIVTRYAAYYTDLYSRLPDYWQPDTLALIDLAHADELKTAVDALFSGLDGYLDTGFFSDISRLRQRSHGFGLLTTNTFYDLIDLADLAEQCKTILPAESAAVSEALGRCVLACGGSEPDAHGLSVYFPQRAEAENRARWQKPLAAFPWSPFVLRYEAVLDSGAQQAAAASAKPFRFPQLAAAAGRFPWLKSLSNQQAPQPAGTSEPAAGSTAPPTAAPTAAAAPPAASEAPSGAPFAVELTDEQLADFASARYFVMTGTPETGMRLIYAGNDCTLTGHTLTAGYRGQALYLEAAGEKFPLTAFWIQDGGGSSYYKSFAVVLKAAEPLPDQTNIVMRIRRTGDQWRLLSAFRSGSGLSTGRQEIRLNEQDEIWIASGLYMPVFSGSSMLPYPHWTYTGRMEGWMVDFKGVYSLKEEPLAADEPVWLQLAVRDTYNREYAFPLFRVSPSPD